MRFRFCTSVFKDSFMNLAHMHALTHGFTERALIHACSDMQVVSAAHSIVKPIELIHWSMRKWNQAALDSTKGTDFEQFKTQNKIRYLIKERLIQQQSYINRWHEAMALGAAPANAPETARILWQFADDAWYLAGDRSTDYNLYSKRLMFLYCYISTELNMLTDKSPQFNASWMFLDRRIEDVMAAGSKAQFAKNLFEVMQTSGYYMATIFKSIPK